MTQVATLTRVTVLEPGRGGLPIDRGADRTGTDSRDVSRISVDLLGGLRVRAGGTAMGSRELGGAKVRRILLALLLQRGAPVSKERLVSLLWEGSPPGGARATLESYVSVLRKTLQPQQGVRASLIMTVADGYAVDMSRVDLDLARYEALLSAALRTGASAVDALPALEAAMTLAASPLLPDEFGCEWLDEARRVHDQGIRQALIAAANKVAGLAPDSAERWARLALEGDPLDESAWHALLQCMESSGQHADGLRVYDDCRRLFAAELGCAPGPALQELYERLLRGADEDSEGLGHLLDAVVRLHLASQLGSGQPFTAMASGLIEDIGPSRSLDQAVGALSRFLRTVGDLRPQFEGGVGA